jgi:hypothetical protein
LFAAQCLADLGCEAMRPRFLSSMAIRWTAELFLRRAAKGIARRAPWPRTVVEQRTAAVADDVDLCYGAGSAPPGRPRRSEIALWLPLQVGVDRLHHLGAESASAGVDQPSLQCAAWIAKESDARAIARFDDSVVDEYFACAPLR